MLNTRSTKENTGFYLSAASFQGAPLRLPKPRSDQFPVRVCSCPLCIINRLWIPSVNAFTLNMYRFLSYTGFTGRNMVFRFVWMGHRNTWIRIQHVGTGTHSRARVPDGLTHMYVYIYLYVFTYLYIYICLCIYIYIYTCT